MDEATSKTVLADFKGTSFSYFGTTTTFAIRNGSYYVKTDGPDGTLKEFKIKYVFGYFPLQQYLIDLGSGRLQALNVVWDTRSKEAGGQRWFHLYPNEEVSSKDPLHWTKRAQNWNYSCAECHSTDLRKNFDPKTHAYKSTWAEIDVSCEACHGPASRHVAWAEHRAKQKGSQEALAKAEDGAPPTDPLKGLVHLLSKYRDREWILSESMPPRLKSSERAAVPEVETCARCHSRRVQIIGEYEHGKLLLDTHRPELLTEGIYQADGQIQDEDYEYGSFLQSKMYHSGVTCSDCHDSHSTRPRAEGNQLCIRCHQPTKYDTPAHHFHGKGGAGAQCVDCHAPKTTYMGIDRRADHSFRIPRPDLSEAAKSTDACSTCHADKPVSWSKDAFVKWFGPRGYASTASKAHYGTVMHEARLGKPGSSERLMQLAHDSTVPAIVRATAVSMLASYPSGLYVSEIERASTSPDPLIRYGAARALEGLPNDLRLRVARSLVRDPLRAIRIEAAGSGVLRTEGLPTGTGSLSSEDRAAFEKAFNEYEASLAFNSDTATALVGRASIALMRHDAATAEKLLKEAISVEPFLQAPYVNLADLYRLQGRDAEAEKLLREATSKIADSAEARHALALALVRRKQTAEAISYLADAARMRPHNQHFQYVYAVALDSSGQSEEAANVITRALAESPYDHRLLQLNLTLNMRSGNITTIRDALRRLMEVEPNNKELQGLARQVSAQAGN